MSQMVKGGYMKLEDKLSSQNKVLLWRRVVKGIYIIAMPGIGSWYSHTSLPCLFICRFVCLRYSGSCYVLLKDTHLSTKLISHSSLIFTVLHRSWNFIVCSVSHSVLRLFYSILHSSNMLVSIFLHLNVLTS